MSDTGIIGAGATLTFAASTNNGQTATCATGAIVQLVSLNPSGIEVKDVDISTMGSTDRWRTFVAGIRNAGELTIEMVFDHTEYSEMILILGTNPQIIRRWTITLSDASTFICDGFIKSLGGAIPMDDKVSQTATIKLTGTPVFSG